MRETVIRIDPSVLSAPRFLPVSSHPAHPSHNASSGGVGSPFGIVDSTGDDKVADLNRFALRFPGAGDRKQPAAARAEVV
jgi:hypothetical protein